MRLAISYSYACLYTREPQGLSAARHCALGGETIVEQVKAAKPTMDYDPEYGRQPGVTAKFVEAVYRSLKKGTTQKEKQ